MTDDEVYLPSVTLVELDAIMKTRHFSESDRERIFEFLRRNVPEDKVLKLTPEILRIAVSIFPRVQQPRMYFDSIIAAYGIKYHAEVITTDVSLPGFGVTTSW